MNSFRQKIVAAAIYAKMKRDSDRFIDMFLDDDHVTIVLVEDTKEKRLVRRVSYTEMELAIVNVLLETLKTAAEEMGW